MEDQFKDSADKAEDLLEKRKQIINMLSTTLQGAMYKVKGIKLESYNDYPKAAQENAQRALDWVEKNGWGDIS